MAPRRLALVRGSPQVGPREARERDWGWRMAMGEEEGKGRQGDA